MAYNLSFYINLGGSIANVGAVRYGFRAPALAYDNIGDTMGVVKVDASTQWVMYGANSPRPSKVRIVYQKSTTIKRSTTRFCEPDKIGDVTVGQLLGGKQVFVSATAYPVLAATIGR